VSSILSVGERDMMHGTTLLILRATLDCTEVPSFVVSLSPPPFSVSSIACSVGELSLQVQGFLLLNATIIGLKLLSAEDTVM
jgi:hypothetical protein